MNHLARSVLVTVFAGMGVLAQGPAQSATCLQQFGEAQLLSHGEMLARYCHRLQSAEALALEEGLLGEHGESIAWHRAHKRFP